MSAEITPSRITNAEYPQVRNQRLEIRKRLGDAVLPGKKLQNNPLYYPLTPQKTSKKNYPIILARSLASVNLI